MNYREILLDALLMFRKSRVIWIFGLLWLIVSTSAIELVKFSVDHGNVICLPFLLLLTALFSSWFLECGLIFTTNQILSNQTTSFYEAWNFCKTKLRTIVGLFFLSFPLALFSVFLVELVGMSHINDTLTWIFGIIVTFLLTSYFTISICAISINNLGAGSALWTGILIVFNNFVPLVVLNFIYSVLRLSLSFFAITKLLGIILEVPFIITMTLAYNVFITKDSYPALSNIQPTA